MELQVHQMNWFRSGKYNFYFWNQCRIFVHSILQKSPPESGKSQNRPLGAISPTLNIAAIGDNF